MGDIAYGTSNDPGLPPVNLPTLGPGQAPQRPQILINKAPQQDQTGGWATFTPPAPQEAAQAPNAQNGGWAAFAPSQTPPAEVGGGEAALRGAAHGLTFGFYPAMAGAVSGAKAALTGEGDFSTAYDKTRQEEEDAYKESEKQHPYISMAADVAGNVPSLFVPGVGVGKAVMAGAKALPRIAQAVRSGAVAGGLFGAGDQTSQGGSAADIALGAAGGAAIGGAAGGVLGSGVEGASKVAQRVGTIVRGKRDPDTEAARLVVDALRADQKQVTKVAGDKGAMNAAQDAGTDVRLADYGGGNTKALLRTATNLAPEARDIVGDVVHPRFAQQGSRIGRFIRSFFGGMESDVGQDAIKAAARKENAPAYKAAHRQSDMLHPKGVWSDKLEQLLGSNSVPEALQNAIARGRDRAIAEGHGAFNPKVTFENGILKSHKSGGAPAYPDLQLWDYTQRELRDMATAAQRAGRNEEADALFQLHKQLLGELDRLVPAFGKARGTAAAFFKAGDALQAGANFVMDTSISPRQAASVVSKMTPAERELFKRGFAGELARMVERTGYNRDVLNSIFLNNNDAKQRLLVALGKDGADRMESLLRIEGIVDRTRKALGNSTTIQQGADAGKFAGTLATIEGLKGAFNPAYLVAIPLIWGGRKAAKEIDERVFTRVAELLMSEDPAVLSRGLDIAAKNPTIRTALRYASDLTSHELIGLLGPSGAASAALTLGKQIKDTAKEAPTHQANDNNDDEGPVAPH